ncbi:uncharacterized protein NEMAJ01_1953 [Nematocida major]|uniref:uncharacterized protein n=1 Tax=Nematocida major TaxID=1912982 RepID=UPI00200803B5|nr:uncharacterized protein NEMAJ01_1953 [Nematocida major]KAH9387057.1 hypothetical protein NEMAJ01_1953 [Nematocida major]
MEENKTGTDKVALKLEEMKKGLAECAVPRSLLENPYEIAEFLTQKMVGYARADSLSLTENELTFALEQTNRLLFDEVLEMAHAMPGSRPGKESIFQYIERHIEEIYCVARQEASDKKARTCTTQTSQMAWIEAHTKEAEEQIREEAPGILVSKMSVLIADAELKALLAYKRLQKEHGLIDTESERESKADIEVVGGFLSVFLQELGELIAERKKQRSRKKKCASGRNMCQGGYEARAGVSRRKEACWIGQLAAGEKPVCEFRTRLEEIGAEMGACIEERARVFSDVEAERAELEELEAERKEQNELEKDESVRIASLLKMLQRESARVQERKAGIKLGYAGLESARGRKGQARQESVAAQVHQEVLQKQEKEMLQRHWQAQELVVRIQRERQKRRDEDQRKIDHQREALHEQESAACARAAVLEQRMQALAEERKHAMDPQDRRREENLNELRESARLSRMIKSHQLRVEKAGAWKGMLLGIGLEQAAQESQEALGRLIEEKQRVDTKIKAYERRELIVAEVARLRDDKEALGKVVQVHIKTIECLGLHIQQAKKRSARAKRLSDERLAVQDALARLQKKMQHVCCLLASAEQALMASGV